MNQIEQPPVSVVRPNKPKDEAERLARREKLKALMEQWMREPLTDGDVQSWEELAEGLNANRRATGEREPVSKANIGKS